ncbi:MAG: DUF924 family protein [Micropepsaceae bacterium]
MKHVDVLTFWFQETAGTQHFAKDTVFDARVKERFLETYCAIVRGEVSSWRDTPQGRLAEIIVLDQFARNMFRNQAQAFLYDPLALALAQEAIRTGDDLKLDVQQRAFVYMPFMHSESAKVHAEAMPLFVRLGEAQTLKYEQAHKAIIDRFGRYPHRNQVLGRLSTEEEIEFIRENKGF